MSAQTLKNNAARFCKDNLLLNLIKVRDENDVEPQAMNKVPLNQLEVTKKLRRMKTMRKKSWKISTKRKMKKFSIMGLRFEEILHTLKASTKENIGGRERLIKQKYGVAKAEIGRANKIQEKHLGNTNNNCTVIDPVYAVDQTIEERKGLKKNEKRKEKKN